MSVRAAGNHRIIPKGRAVYALETAAERMALYDSLPRSTRKLFQNAPYDYDVQRTCEKFEAAARAWGDSPTGLQMVREVIESRLDACFTNDRKRFEAEKNPS